MDGCLRRWQAGMAILLMAGCGTVPTAPPIVPPVPVVPPPTSVQAQSVTYGSVGAQQRRENCQRYGVQAITRRIAGRVVRVATRRYDLDRIVDQRDIHKARRQMADLLTWRLGSSDAVCDQYVQRGIGPFERRFADDAAALMLGLIRFYDDRPVYRIPKAMVHYLGAQGQMTSRILRDLGLPTNVRYQQTRDSYLIPLDSDRVVSQRLIQVAIQAPRSDNRYEQLPTQPGYGRERSQPGYGRTRDDDVDRDGGSYDPDGFSPSGPERGDFEPLSRAADAGKL